MIWREALAYEITWLSSSESFFTDDKKLPQDPPNSGLL